MALYTSVGGVQKEIGVWYTGIGGVNKQVMQVYAGIGGVAKELLPPAVTTWLFDRAGTYTWTVPRTGNYLIRVLSAGGAGGNGSRIASDYSGGGGGAINEGSNTLSLVVNTDYTLTVGAWVSASPGQASAFGTLLTAAAGGRGEDGYGNTAGQGAAGTYAGEKGEFGSGIGFAAGGCGGNVTVAGIKRQAGYGGGGDASSWDKGGQGQDGLIYIQLQ
ncbi:MAG: hypothetical protein RR332_01250 [Clostridiales bacterium]